MKNKGFTVLEIIIVITLMTLLMTFVVMSFKKFNSQQALNKATGVVVTVLNQARTLTLASKGNSQYGVHIDPTRIVLFTGASYSAANSSNIPITPNSLVSLSYSLSGGGNNVIFQRLTGKTTQSGTITLTLIADASSTKSITIYGTGVVQAN
jgi:prepilin-type N-terminal cleavage/methylation domain-containing protein